ncbi:MAG: hypothetical protein IT324_08280 [Anaerolineae bacterium]|nr:hypothetical protein [Anaerolineae bacterium]
MRVIRRIPWRAIRTRLILGAIALGFMIGFPNDTPGGNSLNDRVLGHAKDVLFNYVAWEADAIGVKLVQQQAGLAPYLTEAQRSQYVHDYLKTVTEAQQLDAKINALYSNPDIHDPAAASADLRTRRDQLQAQIAQKQPLAESIIEGQVASVLRDEGFSTFGEIIPAVSAHITELPMLLIVSPRDKIRFELAINLVNLKVDQMAALEDSIDRDLNVSSLVAPLGGLSLYPSMVMESWFTPYVFEVVAHEWTHHYLYFFPLGLSYNDVADARTINETTASLMGKEVSRKVIERFYRAFPDVMAQLPPLMPTPKATTTPDPNKPPPFDYGAAMNETRVTVDALLKDGKIDKAEQYMEQRRQYFAAHGYPIRKLNQAYFAFYGGYQSPGSGVGGTDPIGPAIHELRQRSPSLKAWLETIRSITTSADLLAARDNLRKAGQ